MDNVVDNDSTERNDSTVASVETATSNVFYRIMFRHDFVSGRSTVTAIPGVVTIVLMMVFSIVVAGFLFFVDSIVLRTVLFMILAVLVVCLDRIVGFFYKKHFERKLNVFLPGVSEMKKSDFDDMYGADKNDVPGATVRKSMGDTLKGEG